MKSTLQKESRIVRYFLPGIVFVISQFMIMLFYPNWFTTSENTIDPWIYWGAGDNPELSYSNDFAQTYYLQRYVVILPQILFQSLLGPYFGNLGVGIFWSFLIFCFIWRIGNLIGNWQVSLFVFLVFISDRYLLGAIGMSYTMASSIALGLGFLYLAIQVIMGQKNFSKKRFVSKSFLAGVALGLLANAYLTHAIILSIAAMISFIHSRPHWQQFKQLLTWSLSGFFAITFFFQIVFKLISGSDSILLISQLNFGLSVATNINPWGGGGFLDFWSKGIFNPVVFYWIAIVLTFILVAVNRYSWLAESSKEKIKSFLVVGLAIVLLYCAQTLFYVNPIGYSWGASSLYLVEIIALFVVGLTLQNFNVKISVYLLGIVLFLIVLLSSQSVFLQLLIQNYSKDFFLLAILSNFVFLIVKFMVSSFHKIFSNVHMILLLVLLLSFSLLRNSSEFGESEGGMQNASPRDYYEKLSSERKILLSLSNAGPTKMRIWLTPDNKVPLVSSQLYAYSLISRTSSKADCDQVIWAANSESLIVTFNPDESFEQVSSTYIAPCGFELLPFEISSDMASQLKRQQVVFGYLKSD